MDKLTFIPTLQDTTSPDFRKFTDDIFETFTQLHENILRQIVAQILGREPDPKTDAEFVTKHFSIVRTEDHLPSNVNGAITIMEEHIIYNGMEIGTIIAKFVVNEISVTFTPLHKFTKIESEK